MQTRKLIAAPAAAAANSVMHRFYLPPEECHDSRLVLRDAEAHHARHVLRLGRGERVAVLDGAGHEFFCDVGESGRDTVALEVVEKIFTPPPPWQITLLQAVPKGKIIESIIQKATELGAHRIVPLLSERVTTQLDNDSAQAKVEKWRGTAIEAIKQCGSAWLPRVETPLTPLAYLQRKESTDLALIGSLQEKLRHPRVCFEEYVAAHGAFPKTLSLWVGPEGDFTAAEIELALAAGARPVTLGRLVLRTETAAVYGLSVLNHELQSRR